MLDSVGTTRFGYNADGSLASEDGPWADDTVALGSQNRLRSALTLANPNAAPWSETYAYDAMRRLTNIVSPVGAFGYSYSAGLNGFAGASRLVQRTSLPNAAYVTNSFDTLGRLSRTELRNSSHGVLGQHLYSLNLAHQRTGITNVAGNYVEYSYDPVGQLATATGKESGGATTRLHEKFGYGYDAGGNLQYRTNNALVQTFGVDNLNQLTTVTRNTSGTVAGMTSGANTNVTVNTLASSRYSDNTFAKDGFTLVDGTNTFTAIAQDNLGRSATNAVGVWMPLSASFQYDLNGNLLSDGRRGFDYDAENQLTRVTVTNAWRTEFTYDGRLRRRVRREFTWNGSGFVQTAEVRYIYDDMRVIQERDGNNVPLVAYTRGLDLSGTLEGAGGIGGLLARHDLTQGAPVPAYYHVDGNGNVTTLINAQQYTVARYHYDPYGQLLGQAGPLSEANMYRFSSKEHHAAANLYYYGYRFYDPALQRWTRRDPIEEVDSINLYKFVGNRPISDTDYLGLAIFYDSSCGAPEIAQLSEGLKAVCAAAAKNGCFDCGILKPKGEQNMKALCEGSHTRAKVTVKCSDKKSKNCGITWGNTITIYMKSTACGKGGCTLFHELAHAEGGVGPDVVDGRAYKMEQCAGCKGAATDP